MITLLPSSTAVTIPVLLTVATLGFCETQPAEPALSRVAPSEKATNALSCAVSPFLLNSVLPETRNVIGVGPVAGVTGVTSDEEEWLQPSAAAASTIPRMACFNAFNSQQEARRWTPCLHVRLSDRSWLSRLFAIDQKEHRSQRRIATLLHDGRTDEPDL